MNLVGRYTKVRTFGPSGYGPPLMLDKGRAQGNALLGPYKGEYWDTTRAGLYVPRIAGGLGFSSLNQLYGRSYLPGVSGIQSTLGQGTIALDSAYTAGSAGDAIAHRFPLNANDTLEEIYVFITGYTGTAANVNDLDIEIRADGTAGRPDVSGAALGGEPFNPASATGWVHHTLVTPVALTGGNTYHAIVADADGNITDFATVLRSVTTMHSTAGNVLTTHGLGNSTTDGFAANLTNATLSSIVLVFSSGRIWGVPYSTAASPASNQLARGFLTLGLTESLKILGMVSTSASTSYASVKVFEGTTLSSGSAQEGTIPVFAVNSPTNTLGFMYSAAITLAKATQYRTVFTFGANGATPALYTIGAGADAALISAGYGGGGWYSTIDSAGPVWVDNDEAFPNTSWIVEDQVAVSGGGGGDDEGCCTFEPVSFGSL